MGEPSTHGTISRLSSVPHLGGIALPPKNDQCTATRRLGHPRAGRLVLRGLREHRAQRAPTAKDVDGCVLAGRAGAGWQRGSFHFMSGVVDHAVDMRHRTVTALLLIALALVRAGAPAEVYAACVEDPARPASAAALKPSDVRLSISDPRAGQMVAADGPDDSIMLVIDYWGPQLVPVSTAGPVDQYHLVYFFDEDASPYIGTLMPIPHCNPHILHSAETHVTVDHVMHGSHAVAVLLSGSNNVSVNPPVAARVTFVAR
jgi:hypothetical protein